MTNPHLAYRADIDGLRAIAILAIVVFHAFPEALPGGFVGVDIFFVISGYLISGILLRGMERGDFSFFEFYAGRIRRIFPALIVVLSSCLLFGWVSLLPDEYQALGKHSTAGAAFLANFVFWQEAGYFDIASELKPLLHLWSLSIEEQFYLLWPAALFAAYRFKLPVPGTILLVAACSFLVNVAQVGNDLNSTFYLLQSRVWELLMGGLLAYLNFRGKRGFTNVAKAAGNFTSALGLALILLAVFFLNKSHLFPGWWALLPTMGAVLLISAGSDAWLNRQLLGSRAMVAIGLLSYPLYLWHWPILSFARIMENGAPMPAIRFAAVALSFLLAWLTYWVIERRIRFRKHRAVPLMLVLSLAVIAGAGAVIYQQDGLTFRTKTLAAQLDAFEWENKGLSTRDDCSATLGLPGRCLRSKLSPAIAVLGDSHSTYTFFALQQFFGRAGTGVIRLGKGGCPPLYDLESAPVGFADACREVTNKHLDYVLATPDIHTVVLSSRGPSYVDASPGLPAQGHYLKFTPAPLIKNNLDIFEQALASTFSRIGRAGKQAIFVMDWPELGFDPKACVNIRPLRLTQATKTPCAVPRTDFDARNRPYREMVARVRNTFPGVMLWDPSKDLCDEQYCWAMKDGTMLYRDDNHLSMAGALYIGERFAPE